MRARISFSFLITLFCLSACRPTYNPPPVATILAISTASAPLPTPRTSIVTVTLLPATFTAVSTLTLLPTLTSTPDPYAEWYVDSLRARSYGGGEISIIKTLAVTSAFTRTLIAYPSDGLTIYGFMNIPFGPGPFPVILVNHGYLDPANYQTLTYTTRYTDPLARAGFLVIHSDYRGYGQSDSGPNLFRAGFAIDILNLIALVKTLPYADPNAIGLFGHSMGGGISLRVSTISPDVKAVLLYGAMSGDENANFAKIAEWRGNPALPELFIPPEVIAQASPINYLADIQAPISIHHGEADATVPPEWSADLYARLTALGKSVDYYTYPGQPHTFVNDGQTLLLQRAIEFFDQYLRP